MSKNKKIKQLKTAIFHVEKTVEINCSFYLSNWYIFDLSKILSFQHSVENSVETSAENMFILTVPTYSTV